MYYCILSIAKLCMAVVVGPYLRVSSRWGRMQAAIDAAMKDERGGGG